MLILWNTLHMAILPDDGGLLRGVIRELDPL